MEGIFMKKILIIALCVALAFVLIACGSEAYQEQKAEVDAMTSQMDEHIDGETSIVGVWEWESDGLTYQCELKSDGSIQYLSTTGDQSLLDRTGDTYSVDGDTITIYNSEYDESTEYTIDEDRLLIGNTICFTKIN
jgi:hypothetical protein